MVAPKSRTAGMGEMMLAAKAAADVKEVTSIAAPARLKSGATGKRRQGSAP